MNEESKEAMFFRHFSPQNQTAPKPNRPETVRRYEQQQAALPLQLSRMLQLLHISSINTARKQGEMDNHDNMGDRKDHDGYRDYANEQEDQDFAMLTNTKNGVKNEHSFPVKLHYILSELENDGLDHIISWQPHGRCFIVRNQVDFVNQILPL